MTPSLALPSTKVSFPTDKVGHQPYTLYKHMIRKIWLKTSKSVKRIPAKITCSLENASTRYKIDEILSILGQ